MLENQVSRPITNSKDKRFEKEIKQSNDECIVDMDYTLAEQIFYVYVVRIICGFGILGNILNLTILARRTLSESPYTFLTAMTVSDLFVLITIAGVGVVRCGYCVLTAEQRYKGHVYEVYAFLPLANIAASTSTFITIAIAIERFIFVRFPLLAKKFCNRRSARILIVAIFMLSSTLNFSRFFLNKVTWNTTHPHNKTSVSYLEFRCDDFMSPSGNIIRCRLEGAYSVSQQHTQNDTAPLESQPSWSNSTYVMMLEDDAMRRKNVSEILPLKSDSCSECKVEDLDEDCSRFLISNLSTRGNKETLQNCSSDSFHRIWFRDKQLFRDCFNVSFLNVYRCGSKEIFPYCYDLDIFCTSYSNLLCSDESWEYNATKLPVNITANVTYVKPICVVATDNSDSNVTSNNAISSVRVEATSFGNWAMDGYQIVVAITESLSFLLLVSFNICLIIVLRRKHVKRQTIVASFRVARYSRRQRRDQQRLTLTLLAITCISAATTFTNIVNSHPVSTRLFSPAYSQFFGLLGNLTLLLSNTINFLLYALLNSRFRREFLLVYKVKLFKLFERKAKYTVRSGLENSTEIPLSITNAAI